MMVAALHRSGDLFVQLVQQYCGGVWDGDFIPLPDVSAVKAKTLAVAAFTDRRPGQVGLDRLQRVCRLGGLPIRPSPQLMAADVSALWRAGAAVRDARRPRRVRRRHLVPPPAGQADL
jgi:hypothetical protein